MKTLRITKPWPTAKGFTQPGEYRIPADVSLAHAKCAKADGYGEIVEAASFRKRGRPPRKSAAPENKAGKPAPENKAEVEPMRSGSQRAEPDAASGGEDPGI
jgi:hypothetical protein